MLGKAVHPDLLVSPFRFRPRLYTGMQLYLATASMNDEGITYSQSLVELSVGNKEGNSWQKTS